MNPPSSIHFTYRHAIILLSIIAVVLLAIWIIVPLFRHAPTNTTKPAESHVVSRRSSDELVAVLKSTFPRLEKDLVSVVDATYVMPHWYVITINDATNKEPTRYAVYDNRPTTDELVVGGMNSSHLPESNSLPKEVALKVMGSYEGE